MNLLSTRYGPLDLLQPIGPGLDEGQLFDRSTMADLDGIHVRVLGIEATIEPKEIADRP